MPEAFVWRLPARVRARSWDVVGPWLRPGYSAEERAEVLRLARYLVEESPSSYEDRGLLSWALYANGFLDEAMAEGEKAMQDAPDRAAVIAEFGRWEFGNRMSFLGSKIDEARASAPEDN
ncbi:MAG: hypothetical protein QF464_09900 [Myxococcota bacterium]|jgi:hypothetical protein|nr:hypothetical protein [Myxococcota bacterium]